MTKTKIGFIETGWRAHGYMSVMTLSCFLYHDIWFFWVGFISRFLHFHPTK